MLMVQGKLMDPLLLHCQLTNGRHQKKKIPSLDMAVVLPFGMANVRIIAQVTKKTQMHLKKYIMKQDQVI